MSAQGKDPERVARGLKATVNNPGVSDEAKQSAQQRLEDMGANMDTKTTKTTRSGGGGSTNIQTGDDDPSFLANDVDEDYDDADYVEGHEPRVQDYTQPARGGPAKKAAKEDSNVAGGYKATLKNPNVSSEAKQRAKNILEDEDT